MEKNPVIPATKLPIMIVGNMFDRLLILNRSKVPQRPAKSIMGIAIKNENLPADLRSSLRAIPPAIVEPDLEIPGKIAKAWKKPMKRASNHFRFFNEFDFFPRYFEVVFDHFVSTS